MTVLHDVPMDAAKAVELLLSPGSGPDPVSAYTALRAHGPVLQVAEGHWLGAPPARLEAQIALPALLRRFPGMALDGRPARRRRMNLRGWDALHVTLGAHVPAPRLSVD